MVDLSELRRQVAESRLKIQEAEAAGDEELLLDLICEANELSDALRNYESFEAFWDPAWNLNLGEVAVKPAVNGCWLLESLLPTDACQQLLAAVERCGFEVDSGDATRLGRRAPLPGRVRRSDDAMLAELLWRRLEPATSQLQLKGPAGWRPMSLDSRVTYEELIPPEATVLDAGSARADSQDYDDRDDFTPLFTLLLCLSGPVAFRPDAEAAASGGRQLTLAAGAAVLFPRSDVFLYQLYHRGTGTGTAAVAHMKVLFGPDG